MTPTQTLITFVLDETGSMQSIKDDTIGGFNEFLGRIRQAEDDALFTLIKFDSNRQAIVHRSVPVANVPELGEDTYQPGAATPLIDACMLGIEVAEQTVGDNTAVSMVIQTDGLENASVKYKNSDLAARIKEKTHLGWMFTFLGAGIDAFAQADELGISADHTLRYGRDKSRQAFRAGAGKTTRYMEVGAPSAFMPEERDAAYDGDQ